MLIARLGRISSQLSSLQLTTAEDYQAQIYSLVNAVLSVGMAMTPLSPVGVTGCAIVGDVIDNYTSLNNDSADIANEILSIEDAIASSFNISAAVQNQIRQKIREAIFTPTQQEYVEVFLNSNNLTNVTANLDFNAGLATNALVSSNQLMPVVSVGGGSIGALDATSSLSYLSDGLVYTFMQWDGPTLELFLTFSTAQIVNRLVINMDNYAELEIDTLTTSPDGNQVDDILGDLGVPSILMNGTSGDFSGDIILDFPPRYVQAMRIIVNDRTGVGQISLRDLSCWQMAYSSTGQLTTMPITAPVGEVVFTAIENIFAPYVFITHQISYDGTQFTSINPGDIINLTSSPFFYRASLSTNIASFSNTPLIQTPLDPVASPYYTLINTTTTPAGNGILQRSMQIDNITGSIIIRDNVMPNTLVIQEGAVILHSIDGDYTYSDNTISFPGPVSGITISYQTSSLGNAAIQDLQIYYTPLLYGFAFEA